MGALGRNQRCCQWLKLLSWPDGVLPAAWKHTTAVLETQISLLFYVPVFGLLIVVEFTMLLDVDAKYQHAAHLQRMHRARLAVLA